MSFYILTIHPNNQPSFDYDVEEADSPEEAKQRMIRVGLEWDENMRIKEISKEAYIRFKIEQLTNNYNFQLATLLKRLNKE